MNENILTTFIIGSCNVDQWQTISRYACLMNFSVFFNKVFHLIIMYWLCFPSSNSQVYSARLLMVDRRSNYGGCQIIIRKAWLFSKKSRNIIAATKTFFVTTQLSILLQWRGKIVNFDDSSIPSLLYRFYICIELVLVLIIALILLTYPPCQLAINCSGF